MLDRGQSKSRDVHQFEKHILFFEALRMASKTWTALALIGLTACSTSRGQVPSDFELVIRFEPSQPGAGAGDRTTLYRRLAGDSSFVLTCHSGEHTVMFYPTEVQVAELVDILNRDRIWRMKRSYVDHNILDGGTTVLEIRANARSKEIFMRNTFPDQLDNLFAAIEDMKAK